MTSLSKQVLELELKAKVLELETKVRELERLLDQRRKISDNLGMQLSALRESEKSCE